MPLDLVPSVCPHDCPNACVLEVERIDGRHIGRVRGASAQSYTQAVVCAKVARYAERQHHSGRLSRPQRRVGEKGVGEAAFAPISWDDALDEVADQLTGATHRHGSETVWPYFYVGTMGLVQRDGIHRLRNAMRYSREHLSICNMLSDAGWVAGVGVKRGVDGREMAKSDLIVVWGGNPVSTQVNVMTHVATARKERGANTPSSVAREGRPTALIHPEVLIGLSLGDGDRVRIGNRRGNVVVHARSFDGLQRRVVIVEGLWPNHAFEEGIGINLLTSADPGLPRGGAVFHDTSVWLSPA